MAHTLDGFAAEWPLRTNLQHQPFMTRVRVSGQGIYLGAPFCQPARVTRLDLAVMRVLSRP